MTQRRWVCFVLMLVGTQGVLAATAPVAVSPGSATGSVVGSDCPAFSWSAVEGAEGYELVVYKIGKEGEESQLVLEQHFVGSVSSWTPSLDRCLERGGQYAWSVRAAGEKNVSDWSPPSLFQVAGPGEVEFEEAVEVVRQHLAERDRTAYSTLVRTETSTRVSSSRPTTPAASPLPLAPPLPPLPTLMSVDGNVGAASFTGDGSHLGGVATLSDLCALWDEVGTYPPPTSCAKIVFVTSTTYTGNLGGLLGADAKCNERAALAGLPGTFKAWLSDSSCGPIDTCRDFTQSGYHYLQTAGAFKLVAASWTDLTDGTIGTKIKYDENGDPVMVTSAVWTNTSSVGMRYDADPEDSCNEWLGGSGSARIGSIEVTDFGWTSLVLLSCANVAHLYCFGQ